MRGEVGLRGGTLNMIFVFETSFRSLNIFRVWINGNAGQVRRKKIYNAMN